MRLADTLFAIQDGGMMPGAERGGRRWLREPIGMATSWTKQLTASAPSPIWPLLGLGTQARSLKQSRNPAKI